MNDNVRLAHELVAPSPAMTWKAFRAFRCRRHLGAPGRSAITGTFKGPEEIVGFLARSFELSGGTLELELIDVLGSDWGAVQVQRVSTHRNDKVLDCVEVIAHEIANGNITRTYHRPDQYAFLRLVDTGPPRGTAGHSDSVRDRRSLAAQWSLLN